MRGAETKRLCASHLVYLLGSVDVALESELLSDRSFEAVQGALGPSARISRISCLSCSKCFSSEVLVNGSFASRSTSSLTVGCRRAAVICRDAAGLPSFLLFLFYLLLHEDGPAKCSTENSARLIHLPKNAWPVVGEEDHGHRPAASRPGSGSHFGETAESLHCHIASCSFCHTSEASPAKSVLRQIT